MQKWLFQVVDFGRRARCSYPLMMLIFREERGIIIVADVTFETRTPVYIRAHRAYLVYDRYEHKDKRERGGSGVASHIYNLGDGRDLISLRCWVLCVQTRRPYGQISTFMEERFEHISCFDDVVRDSERRDILHFLAAF
jgi:hypothetical protein